MSAEPEAPSPGRAGPSAAAGSAARSHRRRIIVIASASAGGAALLLLAGYVVFGHALYNALSRIPRDGRDASNTPASFAVRARGHEGFDASPYFIERCEDVRFPSREAGLELAGWYAEAEPSAAAVVLVHGFRDSRRAHSVLIPAGMLRHAGVSVLAIDVREHGDSDVEDGRTALGNEEYLDVLGAWDWLVRERGFAEGRVGLFGASLGGATVLIAMAEEPRVPAAFVDSAFSNMRMIMREELAREGYPGFLAGGGILMARLVSGDDLLAHSPEEALERLGTRGLFLTQGLADARVGPHHGRRLADLAAERGLNVETWFVPDAGHLEAMLILPDEYEAKLVGFFRRALAE